MAALLRSTEEPFKELEAFKWAKWEKYVEPESIQLYEDPQCITCMPQPEYVTLKKEQPIKLMETVTRKEELIEQEKQRPTATMNSDDQWAAKVVARQSVKAFKELEEALEQAKLEKYTEKRESIQLKEKHQFNTCMPEYVTLKKEKTIKLRETVTQKEIPIKQQKQRATNTMNSDDQWTAKVVGKYKVVMNINIQNNQTPSTLASGSVGSSVFNSGQNSNGSGIQKNGDIDILNEIGRLRDFNIRL